MRVLRVKIQRTYDARGTHYTYPLGYEARKFHVICYESQISAKESAVKARGATTYEYVIGLVKDEDVEGFLITPDIAQLSRAEAEAFTQPDLDAFVEKVDHQNEVVAALVRRSRKQRLTPRQQRLLDPDDPERVIVRTKTFRQILDEHGIA